MANCYLRVPYYVASYFRNKSRKDSLPVGSVIEIDPCDPMYGELYDHIHCNTGGTINRARSFCARQWNQMMQGYSIARGMTRKTKANRLLTERVDELTLSDSEVALLTGLDVPCNEDLGEYLCIRMPDEVRRDGTMRPVNAHWQLSVTGAKRVRRMMIDEFWRAFYCYTDRFRSYCEKEGRSYSPMEGLERFMERYDIRNSADNHEKDMLKRNMNRKREAFKFTSDDYVEFG